MMSDAQNLQNVKERMESDFALALNEFHSHNNQVMSVLSEEEKIFDQDNWFEPKMASIREFMKTTKKWIAEDHKHMIPNEAEQQEHVTDDLEEAVNPDDSASQVGARKDAVHSSRGSQVSRASTTSRVSSTRAKQEAEHAA